MTQILRNEHELKSMQQFPGFLPTAKQVICRILNKDNFLNSGAANTLAQKYFSYGRGAMFVRSAKIVIFMTTRRLLEIQNALQ